MPKSRFFRGSDSSGSESSNEEESAALSRDLPHMDISNSGSHESIAVDRPHSAGLEALGRDLLIHALLEERCLNQVRRENPSRSERELHEEAQRRYHLLCQHLAPLNLFSAGLEGSEHNANRQWVRDGLDSLPVTGSAAASSSALQRGSRAAVPAPLRRLLTEGDAPLPLSPNGSFAPTSRPLYQPQSPRRYQRDFKHISLLGKGGYGEVYQAQHNVDGQVYAVKKVPIHPAMIRRAQSAGAEGEAAVEEILKEVRSLSRLSHPNIVRYNNSWIEESTIGDFELASSNLDPTPDAVLGAAAPSFSFGSESLHRIRTQTDTDDQIGFSFESQSRQESEVESNGHLLATVDSRVNDSYISATDSASTSRDERQLSIPGPTLALYVQMAVYPMTLADFIAPKQTTGDIKALAHCFHLEPTIRILLAILEGVEYMHTHNVVHRDLKPANVFLKLEDNPKSNPSCVDLSSCTDCQVQKKAEPVNLGVCIGDFGLVTTTQPDEYDTSPKSAVGTEIYRPATSNDNISPRLDIFAVGVIACELLCKFGTQMERRQTLHELRHGQFPKHFGSCAGRHASRLKDCVASMLSDESDASSLGDLKEMLASMLMKETLRIGGREEASRRSSH